jgi:hypothetical protein
MSKKSKTLGVHDPLRLPEHSRPRTRREFVAQSFMTGAAAVVGPTLLGMLANPRYARAALAGDIQPLLTPCGITTGAGKIPFICFDLAGGGNIAGSNVLVGGPKGQLDFLSVAGYSKLGLPGTMVPNPSTTGNFIDSSFGLRFHADSAHLRGMKARTSVKAMSGTNGTVLPALSTNDTNTNPHNPMYGIYQFGARGGLLNLVGTDSSVSGGNSMAPPTMVIAAAQPTKVSSSADTQGLVSTGQLSALLPNASDVTNVLESMKRISDAKVGKLAADGTFTPGVTQAYTDPAANAASLKIQGCSYTKSAYIVDKYNSPSAVNPDMDPNIVGPSGIFTTAEYQSNNDFQKTAAVMKLVIDGNAAAGTIEMGGFDYHTGDRSTGETRDFNVGNCIGACLEYAARVGKPVMIYVFSDGAISSSGMIDSSTAGRGKGVWTSDNDLFPGLQPRRQAGSRAGQPGIEPADRLLQSRWFAEHHQQSGRQQRAEPGADGGPQLHGAARPHGDHRLPNPVSGAQFEQHPGLGHGIGAAGRLPAARRFGERPRAGVT